MMVSLWSGLENKTAGGEAPGFFVFSQSEF